MLKVQGRPAGAHHIHICSPHCWRALLLLLLLPPPPWLCSDGGAYCCLAAPRQLLLPQSATSTTAAMRWPRLTLWSLMWLLHRTPIPRHHPLPLASLTAQQVSTMSSGEL